MTTLASTSSISARDPVASSFTNYLRSAVCTGPCWVPLCPQAALLHGLRRGAIAMGLGMCEERHRKLAFIGCVSFAILGLHRLGFMKVHSFQTHVSKVLWRLACQTTESRED